MENTVTYGHIEIMPYEFVRLHELKILKTINDHARMIFTGIISEKNASCMCVLRMKKPRSKPLLQTKTVIGSPFFEALPWMWRKKLFTGSIT